MLIISNVTNEIIGICTCWGEYNKSVMRDNENFIDAGK